MPTKQQRAKSSVTFRSNNDVALHVPDLARAESFYVNVLGFRLISRSDTQLHVDMGSFHLWINRDNTLRPFIPSFDVSDYKSAERQLLAAGCKYVKPAPDSPCGYFQDPFGFMFDVIEH
jgi:catechol 2,3-dioxygenase-like lactoylglutathione lyase family enzyme